MIKSFRHAGLKKFFETGSKAGIQPAHARRLDDQLIALKDASEPFEMNTPGWELHPLKGQDKGHWAVKVDGNWRLVFAFEDENAILVDYRDYH